MNKIYPNDTLFSQQWALYNGRKSGGIPGSDVGALGAWSIANTSPNVVVAVLDTGIQLNHPDLKDNIWINQDEIPGNNIDDDDNHYTDDVNGWSFVNKSPDPRVEHGSPVSHGTHVAGIIGAIGNNNIGIAGVTWDVQIMPVNVYGGFYFKPNGQLIDDPESDDWGEAIRYAVDNGAMVINISMGSPIPGKSYEEWKNEHPIQHQWRFDALKYAVDNGVTVVFSAGNYTLEIGENNTFVPGYLGEMLEGVINVGAIDDMGKQTFYTNRGEFVDISAPGGVIDKDNPGDKSRAILSTNLDNGYVMSFGTSMAAPIVTGAIALMLGIDSSLTPARIEQILKESATKSQLLLNAGLGEGLILDIEAALRMTKESLEAITETAPSPESLPSSKGESNQLNDGFANFTDADDVLTNQSDLKYRLMGGNDYHEITGGINNFANGNLGDDRFVLRSGEAGQYLGGKGSDTFEVLGGIGTDVNGDKGDDTISLNGGQGRYRGGDNNDRIDVFSAKAGSFVNGNSGEDIITGSVGGVIYRGGKDNDTLAVSQGEAWGDKGKDTFRGVKGEGYAAIQDYSIGEDVVELSMNGSWSKLDSGLMFADDTGDQIMLLVGITDIEQVALV